MGILNTTTPSVARKIGISNKEIYEDTKAVNNKIVRLIGAILENVT